MERSEAFHAFFKENTEKMKKTLVFYRKKLYNNIYIYININEGLI